MNLEYLSLSSNELSGEIPAGIGNLTNLTWLWLYGNELCGEVPDSICNLSLLDWGASWTDGWLAYLFNNQLCPPYPECIEEYVGQQETSNCNFLTDNIIDLHEGHNLISFYVLPEDNTVDNILSPLDKASLARFVYFSISLGAL